MCLGLHIIPNNGCENAVVNGDQWMNAGVLVRL